MNPSSLVAEPRSSTETVAGYRLVRRLGSGSRAEVFLGVRTARGSQDTGSEAKPTEHPRDNRTAADPALTETGVAIKMFRPETDPASIGVELDALSRVSSRHAVCLLDVATLPDRPPAAILQRIPGVSIARLLRDRESLELGEIVTLVAPICDLVERMHRGGVAHGAIGAANLFLGPSAEPVLLGFGHASLFSSSLPPATLDPLTQSIDDRRGLVSLTLALLQRARLPGDESDALAREAAELVGWLRQHDRPDSAFVAELESRLFDLADPLVVDSGRVPAATLAVPARLGGIVAGAGSGGASAVSNVDPLRGRRVERLSAALDTSPGDHLRGAFRGVRLRAARTRIGAQLATVRKPLWIATGAVAAALAIALALVPSGDASRARSRDTGAGQSAHPLPSTSPQPRDSALTKRPPQPSTSPKAAGSATSATTSETDLPENPAAALPILLAARAECIRELSIGCLADIDQPSSAQSAADVAVIESIRQGSNDRSDALVTAPKPRLIQRWGDTAIVSLGNSPEDASAETSKPASALMIREEAGWRIRELLGSS